MVSRIGGEGEYYLFIDEIQLSYKVRRPDVDIDAIAEADRELAYTTFYDVLNDLILYMGIIPFLLDQNGLDD